MKGNAIQACRYIRILVCPMILVGAITGCSVSPEYVPLNKKAQKEQEEREKKQAEEVKVIRKEMRKLRQEMDKLEDWWEQRFAKRHADWGKERLKKQREILIHKWNNSNRSSVNETVEHMKLFGCDWYALGGISVDLDNADYQDIATTRIKIQDILYGPYDELCKQLKRYDEMKHNDYWNWPGHEFR